ncbi:MAG: salicylate 5-hydroxylase large subunit [Alphaproteobacteria bacterium]|jgi:salicylate 5-hydroxylase large subunit
MDSRSQGRIDAQAGQIIMASALPTDNLIDRKWPEEGFTRVPYWVYSDPKVFQREMDVIFGGPTYNYIGLECEIPNPGDFRRTFIGDKPVIFTRDEDGQVQVVANRCAHRGVKFCYQEHGNNKEFICPYHQWTYDLKGKLIGVPFRRGVNKQGGMPEDFKLEDHNLQTLKVEVRGGAIFASFQHDMPSLEEYFGPLMMHYYNRIFDGRKLHVLGYSRQRIRSNWKIKFENIKDPYHASLLHVFLVSFGLFRADTPSKVENDPTGLHAIQAAQRGEQKVTDANLDIRNLDPDLKLHNPEMLQPYPEWASKGPETVVMQTLFPNLIIQQQSNTIAMRQIRCFKPEEMELHWTFFGYEDDDEEMTMRRLRQANLMGPAGYVSVDDSEVMESAQSGVQPYPEASAVVEMGGRDTENTPHMVTESSIRAFYKAYREIMGF